ncbi:MAG: response regulator [Betaproteobacteria bacterium]
MSRRAANDAALARSHNDDDPPAMVWTARPDLACESVSRAWCEFTGHGAEAALGEGWSRCLHPEDLARWLDACVRAFDARASFEIEYRMRRRDGQYRWVLDRARPRYARDGSFLGYVGACVDIDERKRAELDLARALERERRLRLATEAASRIKDELVGSVLERLAEPLLRGVRVLVVEADAAARESMVRVLSAAGAEIRTAASSAEALERLGDAWRPDVMLADTGAPACDGLVSVRAVRPARADARLAKPVEPVALLAAVARLVRTSR